MRTRIALALSMLITGLAGGSMFAQTIASGVPVVSISPSEIYIDEKLVEVTALASELKRVSPTGSTVYLRANKQTKWEAVTQVLSILESANMTILKVKPPQ